MVAQQYQLPESALSRISKSEEPRYWRLEVPARNDRPAHHLFFTEGLATQHGLEFTLRVSGSPLTDEHSPMRLAVQLMYYREMLDGGVELAPFERVPLGAMMPFPWAAHQQNQGDCSALVVTDPVLRHPRITILGLLCLSPPMSAATQTLGNPKVAELLTPLVPDLITDLDSPPDPNRPDLAAALRQIAQSAPQKPVIHGLMFELRLRQQGRALDLLVGPRWVAPILHAVEQIYGKEAGPVHPGSTIICVNESHTGVLIISHQDDEGQPIAPGQGRFVVRQMKYARAVNDEGEEIALEPAKAEQLATLSEAELYENHNLIRHFEIELSLSRSVLSRLLSEAQQRLLGHDFDSQPACIFDYSSELAGQVFRFIPISIAYYENELAVDDSGEVVPTERQLQAPALTHHEFIQALLRWMKNPKLEDFLALRQEIVRSPDYQPYKEPRPLDQLRQAVGERRHKDILAIFEREGVSLLLSPEAHMAVTIAHKHLGNAELELQSRWLSKLCGEAIEQSGDGSLDRPYLVLHINNEYDFLTRHQLVPVQQSLVHHAGRALDVMTLDTGQKIAFDVTDMQNAMFGGSSGAGSTSKGQAQARPEKSPRGVSPKGCFLALFLGAILMVFNTLGLRQMETKEPT